MRKSIIFPTSLSLPLIHTPQSVTILYTLIHHLTVTTLLPFLSSTVISPLLFQRICKLSRTSSVAPGPCNIRKECCVLPLPLCLFSPSKPWLQPHEISLSYFLLFYTLEWPTIHCVSPILRLSFLPEACVLKNKQLVWSSVLYSEGQKGNSALVVVLSISKSVFGTGGRQE